MNERVAQIKKKYFFRGYFLGVLTVAIEVIIIKVVSILS